MSRLPFELLLALRYLRPKRTFVSVITLISVIGVSLGVAVLIIVLSVMTGFDHRLRDQILGFNTHLEITTPGHTIKDYAGLIKETAPAHFESRGIFHVGYYDFDASWIVGSLEDAQELYNLSNTVHGIMVVLHDPYTAPQLAKQFEIQLGPEYRISTWIDKNSN